VGAFAESSVPNCRSDAILNRKPELTFESYSSLLGTYEKQLYLDSAGTGKGKYLEVGLAG
jgi:hypothetical protein